MEAKHAARVFGALAHAARLELFRTLAREGGDGLCAGELAERCELPPSTLSFHLHELTAVGLLDARRDGRRIHYALQPQALRELQWFLGEDCCQGRLELLSGPGERIADRLAAPDERRPGERRTVLFLCSHNAARSQMAEAMLRQLAGDRFDVLSAGMRPRDVHPLTRQVLREAGVPTDGLFAKDLGALLGKHTIDDAIVLCPEAQQDCPRIAPFAQRVAFWPLPDPTTGGLAPQQALRRFRNVRDAVREKIERWLADERVGAATPRPTKEKTT